MRVIAYTDGSAAWQSGLGGAGVYITFDDQERFISKPFSNTKVGRMEQMAVLLLLRAITDKSIELIIYSDSQYVVKSITEGRLKRWSANKYQGIKNEDLWRQIHNELKKFEILIKIIHIKGHNGTFGNEMADILANYRQFKPKDFKLDLPIN